MRYVSIDIEGTGLDVEKDQVLQIGAVVDDTDWWFGEAHVPVEDLPTFNAYILYDRIEGQIGGLAMNAGILEKMKAYQNLSNDLLEQARYESSLACRFYKHYEAVPMFRDFLVEHTYKKYQPNLRVSKHNMSNIPDVQKITITVAGKNFGTYDRPMLMRLPMWDKSITLAHRTLDPAILYWNPWEDEKLPNLDTCLKRAGHTELGVTHDAVEDARDVIRSLRSYYVKGRAQPSHG